MTKNSINPLNNPGQPPDTSKQEGTVPNHFFLLSKIIGNSGQHAIEYAAIMILVMAGIIISGPFVIRSWNANIQSWEDSVIDSYNDPLLEAPNVIGLPACNCAIVPGDPNFDCGPIGGCAETELFSRCDCNPLGCGLGNPFVACVEGSGTCTCDPLCCSTPVPVMCGGTCPPNQMQMTFTCGCGPVQTGCQPDPLCGNECNPPIDQPPRSTPCPGYQGCLIVDRNNVLVDACSGGCDHCEFLCDPPYFPVAAYTQCGICPTGYILQGPCAAGTCDSPLACSPGQCRSG